MAIKMERERESICGCGHSAGISSPVKTNKLCASVTKQYNLVLANGRWRLVAGKVTVGLLSHWQHVTEISGSPPTDSRPRRVRWAPAPALLWSMVDFTTILHKTMIDLTLLYFTFPYWEGTLLTVGCHLMQLLPNWLRYFDKLKQLSLKAVISCLRINCVCCRGSSLR